MDLGDLAEKLSAMIRENASADAMALIAAQSDPVATASAISAAVNALYSSHRDVGRMVVAAYFGVAWCLGQASLQLDPEVAASLKRRARAMSFNAAANCWPGWGDQGVTIEDGHVAAGLALAGMCRSLGQDLDLGPKEQGTANWLVGALELALGRIAAARAAFDDAQGSYAALGEEAPQTLMVQAYDALAATYGGEDNGQALNQALERLRALGTKDGDFFADQVEKARQELGAGSGTKIPNS